MIPSLAISPRPIAPPSFDIDRRSFHVFSKGGKCHLFDRGTATLSEVDPGSWRLLGEIESGTPAPEAIARYADQLGLDDDAPIWEALGDLKNKGFFEYVPVDPVQQDGFLEQLWAHHPRRIQLLMAQSCNLGCRYCYAWRNGSNQLSQLMPFDIAAAAVDHLIAKSGDRTDLQLTFFGGEPLLNWDVLTQVVDYAERVGVERGKTFQFEVVTNATLLTKERVHYLAARQFLLMVSIDGWKEMHEYNRPAIGVDSNYDEIVANAIYADRYYRDHGLWPIKVRANLTHRYHEGPRVKAYLESLGFQRVEVSPIEPLPHSDPSPSAMTEDDCDEYDRDCMRSDRERLEHLNAGMEPTKQDLDILSLYAVDQLASALKGVICGVGRNTQCVDTKGNIYPCHRYEGMKAYILGNVFTGLDRERTMRYYRSVNKNATDRCHSCWIRDYCAGGCPWLLSSSTGVIVDPSERECDRRRGGFEHYLWMRADLRAVRPDLFANSDYGDPESWNLSAEPKQSSCGGGCFSCAS